MSIRDASAADLGRINAIYNDVLLHSNAIYSEEQVSMEQRTRWFAEKQAAGFPVLIAEIAGEVAGFATYGEFRAWSGFRFTVEGSIHIDESHRRSGLGRGLLDALVEHARAAGKHRLIAGVDSENTASLRFLTAYGFEESARLPEVGYKFGRFLDLCLLSYAL